MLYNCSTIEELKTALEERMCGTPIVIHYKGVEYDLLHDNADLTPLLELVKQAETN